MAISKEKKTEVLDELKTAIDSSQTMVFINFQGISGTDTAAFRKALRDKGVSYTVAKKTLSKMAFAHSPITGTMPEIPGEFGLAYLSAQAGGNDLIAPAREVYVFEKKNPLNLKITGGVFEGKYMTRDEMLSIATIPDTEVLRGMFVNIINSPIQGFVIALNALADKREQAA